MVIRNHNFYCMNLAHRLHSDPPSRKDADTRTMGLLLYHYFRKLRTQVEKREEFFIKRIITKWLGQIDSRIDCPTK